MSESPSAILVRAADLIRDTAAAAEQQGWRFDDEWGYVRDANGDLVAETSSSEGRWIALMSPAVAGPVERWLRETSRHVRTFGESADGWAAAPALAFARAVLGEKEAQ